MNAFNSKARLVNGVVLHVGAKVYTNANLTDDVARQFLAQFPQRKDWFASLPEEPEKVKEEPKAEEAATPKAPKKSKKRKS